MCGRYNILPNADWSAVEGQLDRQIAHSIRDVPARYNIAPSEMVPMIINDSEGHPSILDARWGFIPSWWKQQITPTKTSNARSETAATKPMWKSAWRHQRCLIPATGWYEWFNYETGTKKPLKIPHHIQPDDSSAFLFAGLWSKYSPSSDRPPIATCTIVTIPSPTDVAEIHERTPVILKPSYWRAWLDQNLDDAEQPHQIINEGAMLRFKLQPISTAVSKTINRGPECLQPQDWPELAEQGNARASWDNLNNLRRSRNEDVASEIQIKLSRSAEYTPAERRLWIRELCDRDDSDQLEDTIQAIRNSLKPTSPHTASLF